MPWAEGGAVRHRRSLAPIAAVVAALAIGLLLAACGTDHVDLPTSVPTSATPPPLTSPSASPSVSGASAGTLVVDDGLLAILPAAVDGIVVQPATDTANGMATDTSLARSASAIAVGMVVAAGASGADDLAVATVVQLRTGVGTDAFYATWRDDYDAAACAPAGGVASHAQQMIGSHRTEVTACAGGAKTLHTRLPGDILVSVTAVGDRGLGDLVIAGLRG